MTDNYNPRGPWQREVLGILFYIFLLYVCIRGLASCGVAKPVVTQRDSVRVEIRERIVHDTAFFSISGDYKEKTVKDTVSHLQSEYAESDAAIRGGLLYHSLQTFPKTIRVPYAVTVHDTVTIHHKAETVYVDVPRNATKWENFLEICGYILLGCMVFVVILAIVKNH